MLSTLRSHTSGIIAKALMAFLILSFGVWGVGDMLRSAKSSWLVKVGDMTIGYPEFAHNKELIARQLQAMGMTGIDDRALENDVLRRMVEQKLVALRIRELGLKVGDPLLADRVKAAPMFQDKDGKFDPNAFKGMLMQRQMSEAGFLDQMKTDMLAGVLTTSMSMEGATLPEGYATLLAANEAQTRDVVLVNVTAGNAAAISDADIQTYYDAHKDSLYLQPERRSFSYVSFGVDQLKAMVEAKITDEELKDRYEGEKENFKSFEEAKPALREELRGEYQDTVAEDLTNDIEDALAGGANLEQAAQKVGIKSDIHKLDHVAAEDGGNALEKAVIARGFSLQDGETSSLEATNDGMYYVVALDATVPATPKPLDQVKADVRSHIEKEQASDAVRKRASDLKAELEKNRDWKAVLQKAGLNGQTVSNVTRPAKGKNGTLPALLQQAVFEHGIGNVAGPMMQGNGTASLAIVTAVHQPKVTAQKTDSKAIEALNNEVIAEYFTNLATRYPVRVNEKLLAQMHAQGTDE